MRRAWACTALICLVTTQGFAQEERPRLVAQVGHASPVSSVAFSPDGRHVLTGSFDKTARLWEIATGREIRRFVGHTDPVASVAFSPDGRWILTGTYGPGELDGVTDDDRTARLWDVRSGREIRKFLGHSASVRSVAISPDGHHVLTGSFDKTARLWDTETGRQFRKFGGHTRAVMAVAFSPDGRRVATGSLDKTVRIWDAGTGQEVGRLEGLVEWVRSIAFSPGGRHILTGGEAVRLWDAKTGRGLRTFEGHTRPIWSVAFSPDGRCVLTGGMTLEDRTARLWDVATGEEIRQFQGSRFTPVAFSPDGARVFAGYSVLEPLQFGARLWDVDSGTEIQTFEGQSHLVHSVAISHDGRSLLTGSADRTAHLWDVETGREARQLRGHENVVSSAVFSPDDRRVLTGSRDKTARLWDAGTGREIRRFQGHGNAVSSVAFSSDGRRVLTGSGDKTARLWDGETGREVRTFEGHEGRVYSVAFSTDGRRILTGGTDKTVRLWHAGTGREVRRFEGHQDAVSSVAFSPDGRRILSASDDKTVRLWDVETGLEIRKFEGGSDEFWAGAFTSAAFRADGRSILTGSFDTTATLWETDTGRKVLRLEHSYPVSSVACSSDDSWLITGSLDCSTKVWKADTGAEICRLISFGNGEWAVVDPAGRYDASNGGDVEGLHWVVGDESIALAQLKDRYYDPGLLAKHMGFNPEPLREVRAFTAPKLFPEFELAVPTAERPMLGIKLRNRGGGIGRVVVRINGKELTADARAATIDPYAEEIALEVPVAGDPRLKPGERNVIEVLAFNAEGYLRSRGFSIEYTPLGEAEVDPTELWAVVAGISDYAGTAIDLKFAAKDAADFALGLETAAQRLFGAEKTHVTLLEDAGRKELVAALEEAARAKPKDILVLYLAGHGVSRDDTYYYLTKEARSAALNDPAIRKTAALSSRDLTELVKRIPALKQVLILDTCASGRFVEKLTETREIPSSQIRALERVKDRTGLHILAGCAADRVSYEATRYGQGLLTYSLLLAMKAGKLRAEEYVDVSTLFSFAADKVPEFAKDIGGVQRPIVAAPRGGGSFDIGRLTEQDRRQLALRSVRPLFTRSSLIDQHEADDLLGLAKEVDAVLGRLTAWGRDAPLVFVDVRGAPDAYRIAGTYTTTDGETNVRFKLRHGEKASDWIEVEGAADDLAALAARIVAEVRKRIG